MNDEKPSDRMVRGLYRGTMYALGLCCLVGATISMMDNRATNAAAGAALGIAWIMAARLMWPY